MLPVVDKPAIQYVVEEAVRAGPRRRAADHRAQQALDRGPLRPRLRARGGAGRQGRPDGLAQVRESTELATVHYVRQGDPRGLGHAVLCAAEHVGDQPFAVLLGDDLIDPATRCSPDDRGAGERFGGSVVALMEVDPEQIRLYGCAAVEPTDDDGRRRGHRPGREAGPGRGAEQLVVIGRYVLRPGDLRRAAQTPPGAAARSSSPTRCGRWPVDDRKPAAACTACCSAGAATTPATSGLPAEVSSPASGRTWPRSSCPGSASTWTSLP